MNLPPSLSINSATGLITGWIGAGASQDSPYTVQVTVTDSGNPRRSSETSFSWVVRIRREAFVPVVLVRK
jgi:hypothetical protein